MRPVELAHHRLDAPLRLLELAARGVVVHRGDAAVVHDLLAPPLDAPGVPTAVHLDLGGLLHDVPLAGVGLEVPGEARAADVARRVRTGTFSVNSFTYNTEAPFGGVKCSGVGRDTGPEALQSYYELKTVNLTQEMAPLFA